MGQKWVFMLLWGLNGLWCTKMVGTRWNKVEKEQEALGLITLFTLLLHKWPNVDIKGEQNGSKMGLYGYYWI